MAFAWWSSFTAQLSALGRLVRSGWTKSRWLTLGLTLGLVISSWGIASPALAGLNDDHFDGNIFALYAGNGSLVPPRVTLADSLKREDRPTILTFYVEDSSDCKQFSSIVSQLQAFYGRAADIIPINVDSMPPKPRYTATEPGYYYEGIVPQTLVFNKAGQVVLNAKGAVAFEKIDDVMREVFDLLPRSQSVELRRRLVNEVNSELVNQ